MAEVPKIVRERLKAARSVSDHPDPDVLSAFSERLLPDRERAIVLEHLARCDDCREVVALALPAIEAADVARVRAVHKSWLTLPVLRWSAVAAGVAIISLAGVLYQHRQATMMARFNLPSPEAADRIAKSEHDAAAKPEATLPAKDQKQEPRAMLVAKPPGAEAKLAAASRQPQPTLRAKTSGGIGGAADAASAPAAAAPDVAMAQPSPDLFSARAQKTAGGLVAAEAGSTGGARKQDQLKLSESRVPSSSQTVEVQGEAVGVVAENGRREQVLDAQNEQAYARSDKVDKAKPPVTVQSAPMSATVPFRTAPPSQPSQPSLAGYLPAPRWAISATGGLQRSFDEGKTWQDVNVNAQSAVANSLQLETTDDRTLRKEAAKEKKGLVRTLAHPIFRAVASIGSEVWAGGMGGALYHSVDGGMHWMHVSPSTAGISLTGDIIRLEFPDSQHGKIITSTPEVWTTADGGQSWQH
jgi:putative zinc finger protein